MTLGPGSYDAKLFIGFEGKKNSLSPRLNDNFQEKEQKTKPGPGYYDSNPQTLLKKPPAFKIGTSQRAVSVPKSRLDIPDPSTYNPNDSFVKAGSSSFGFGTSNRPGIAPGKSQDVPGPGQYYSPNKSDYKFHMGIRLNNAKMVNVPGPG